VLLNTYYADMPGLRDPQVIWLFSTPLVRSVARPVSRLFGDMVFRAMYRWQVGRFFRDPQVRQRFLPLLYRQFTATPSTHEAFFGLNRDLRHALAAGTSALPRLGRFDRPVRIIFGAADPYSTPGWHAASTSCSRPRSCSCWKEPATTCRWTSPERSPG
jgi:haloalkane dehalogenase